jgi:hypothetical protein
MMGMYGGMNGMGMGGMGMGMGMGMGGMGGIKGQPEIALGYKSLTGKDPNRKKNDGPKKKKKLYVRLEKDLEKEVIGENDENKPKIDKDERLNIISSLV